MILPFEASRLSPAGKPSAAKVNGRAPVAGIEYIKGDPGLKPKTEAPLMRGVAGAGGVNGVGNSAGAEAAGAPTRDGF